MNLPPAEDSELCDENDTNCSTKNKYTSKKYKSYKVKKRGQIKAIYITLTDVTKRQQPQKKT